MKEKIKLINFVQLPNDFMKDRNLTKTDCFLFGHIYNLTKQKGYCYCRNCSLLEKTFIKKRTLNYSLKRLEKNGYIKIERVRVNDKVERRIFITDKVQRCST